MPAESELAPDLYSVELAPEQEPALAGSNRPFANHAGQREGRAAGLTARAIARLQRQQGNFFVQRMLKGPGNSQLPPKPARPSPRGGQLTEPAQDDDWLAQRIEDASGGGQPIEPRAQARLEAGLHDDLTAVRVHTDADAAQMAEALDAVAFTTGQDIFFAPGAYQPGTKDGLELLAHEAAHTAQQAAGPVAGTAAPGGVTVSTPADPFEQAAERSAHDLASRTEFAPPEPAAIGSTGGREPSDAQVVQRTPGPADLEDEEKKRPPEQPLAPEDLAKRKKLEDESE